MMRRISKSDILGYDLEIGRILHYIGGRVSTRMIFVTRLSITSCYSYDLDRALHFHCLCQHSYPSAVVNTSTVSLVSISLKTQEQTHLRYLVLG